MKSPPIQKRISLETKLKVLFWFEWIEMNVKLGKNHTEKQNESAWKWAETITKEVLSEIKKSKNK